MAHQHGAVLLAIAMLASLGCSGSPGSGGEQPYGAGASGSDEEMSQPDASAGIGGASGSVGAGGIGGVGGDIAAGQGGASGDGGEGGADELPACEAPQPALVGACVTLPEPASGEFVSMTGVVEAIEQPDASSCAHRALGAMGDAAAGEIYDVVIDDGESTVRISVRIPWSSPFVSIGDTVAVEYKAELPVNSVGHGVLTVRDAEGGLLLWVVQAAHGFDSIGVPELMISDDPNKCLAPGPCGSSSTHGGIHAFDLIDEVSIGFGEIGEVGDFMVQAADNTKVNLENGPCGFATSDFHRVVIIATRAITVPLGRTR